MPLNRMSVPAPNVDTSVVVYVVGVETSDFTIDVTAANLLLDTTVKDFVVVSTTNDVILDNTHINKISPTSLLYTGPDLLTGEVLEIKRDTPTERYQYIQYKSLLDSAIYNEELQRIWRKFADAEEHGIGPGSIVSDAPIDEAYGPSWATDMFRSRTANNLYDKFEAVETYVDNGDNSLQSSIDSVANDVAALTTALQNEINNLRAQLRDELRIKVGELWFTTDDSVTNPATVLGYGTWERYAEGRCLVGVDRSKGAYETSGSTGGAERVTLTEAQMQHKHRLPIGYDENSWYGWGNGSYRPVFGEQVQASVARITSPIDEGSGAVVTALSDFVSQFLAGNLTESHENMQPYVTVNIWRRLS